MLGIFFFSTLQIMRKNPYYYLKIETTDDRMQTYEM